VFNVGDILEPSEYGLNSDPSRAGAVIEVVITHSRAGGAFRAVIMSNGGIKDWTIGQYLGFMPKYWQLLPSYKEKTYEDCL
jgi:hypothetical protein